MARQPESILRRSAAESKHLLPGQETLRETLRKLVKKGPVRVPLEAYKKMSPKSKAIQLGFMGLGAPAAFSEGEGRGRRIGEWLGTHYGFLALNKLPLVAQMLGVIAAERLGGKAGQVLGGRRG